MIDGICAAISREARREAGGCRSRLETLSCLLYCLGACVPCSLGLLFNLWRSSRPRLMKPSRVLTTASPGTRLPLRFSERTRGVERLRDASAEVPAGIWRGIDMVSRSDGYGESVSTDPGGWILRFEIVWPDHGCGSSCESGLGAERCEGV